MKGQGHGGSHIHGPGHDKAFALVGLRGAGVGQGIVDGVDLVHIVFLLLLVPAACWDGLLGPGQAPLTGLLQGRLLLGLLLLLFLQPILGRGRVERSVNGARRES